MMHYELTDPVLKNLIHAEIYEFVNKFFYFDRISKDAFVSQKQLRDAFNKKIVTINELVETFADELTQYSEYLQISEYSEGDVVNGIVTSISTDGDCIYLDNGDRGILSKDHQLKVGESITCVVTAVDPILKEFDLELKEKLDEAK